MDSIFTDRTCSGGVAPYVAPSGFTCDLGGLSIMALPPGKVDLDVCQENAIINVVPFRPATWEHCRLNGEKLDLHTTKTQGTSYIAKGAELSLNCHNLDWEILVELSSDTVRRLDEERFDSLNLKNVEVTGGTDAAVGVLAQLAIDHLRGQVADRLYLEGLAISIAARTLVFASPRQSTLSTHGTDRRIARAIDYAHEHLTSGLSISELAAIACMSPSWFSRAFKAATGKTVHNYVLDHRLEQARLALQTNVEPIGNIAYACGFTDHAHLSRLFKRKFGVSPRDMRGSFS